MVRVRIRNDMMMAGYPVITTSFNSVTDFMNLEETPSSLRGKTVKDWRTTRIDTGWYGAKTLKEAQELAKYGNTEEAKRIQDLSNKIRVPDAPSIARRMVWSEDDGDVSIDRLEYDKPFRATAKYSKRGIAGNYVTVAINCSANCGVGTDDMRWNVLAGLAIAKALVKSGRNVEVSMFLSGSRETMLNGQQFSGIHAVPLIQGGDDLSVQALSKAMSPSFFRVLGFRSIENNAHFGNGQVAAGYGSSYDLGGYLLKGRTGHFDENQAEKKRYVQAEDVVTEVFGRDVFVIPQSFGEQAAMATIPKMIELIAGLEPVGV